MVIFYKKWKKYNETQLTKRIDLNIRKNDESFTIPRISITIITTIITTIISIKMSNEDTSWKYEMIIKSSKHL